MCCKCSRFVIRTPTPTDSHLALSLSIFQAVPVMASPLPVSFILVVLLLAKSPLCQAGDCKGHRQVLRGPPGYVTDGAGNYSVNGNCEWLIKGGENGFCHYFLLFSVIIQSDIYRILHIFQLPTTVTALS